MSRDASCEVPIRAGQSLCFLLYLRIYIPHERDILFPTRKLWICTTVVGAIHMCPFTYVPHVRTWHEFNY